MTNLSEQEQVTAENLVRLRYLRARTDFLVGGNENTEYGIAAHEIRHLQDVCDRAILRCQKILGESHV